MNAAPARSSRSEGSPPRVHRRTFASSLDQLDDIRSFVVRAAEEVGWSDEITLNQIQLAVDEACSNVMRHAYGLDSSKVLHLITRAARERFEVTIRDQGKAFDPTSYHPRPVPELARHKIAGGMGIALIRRLMDEVRYDSDPERSQNELRLTKLFRPAALPTAAADDALEGTR